MSDQRRVLIYSDYLTWPRVFNSAPFEFINVIRQLEDCDIISPKAKDLSGKITKTLNGFSHYYRYKSGLMRPSRAVKAAVKSNYDIFIFIGSHMTTLAEIQSLVGWESRCKIKIAYVFESWVKALKEQAPYIKLLNKFDHVFLLHGDAASYLADKAKAQCHYLPGAVDTSFATPYPQCYPRNIDFLSYGRRLEPIHKELFNYTETRKKLYFYDSLSIGHTNVFDWEEHRKLVYNTLKRSQYFICFDHATGGGEKALESAGEQVLPIRLFEGAASGAVMIGSKPKCAAFQKSFPWPNAVIDVPVEPKMFVEFLENLPMTSEEHEKLGHLNAIYSLRHHDWSHRWKSILDTIGLDYSEELQTRQSILSALADEAERTHDPNKA